MNKPYVRLVVSDRENARHVFKIAYDGYSKPYVGLEIAGRAREVYSMRYLKDAGSLEVVYGLKYESGVKKFSRTIQLV